MLIDDFVFGQGGRKYRGSDLKLFRILAGLGLHFLGCGFDSSDYVDISRAPAKVTFDPFANLIVGRIRIPL